MEDQELIQKVSAKVISAINKEINLSKELTVAQGQLDTSDPNYALPDQISWQRNFFKLMQQLNFESFSKNDSKILKAFVSSLPISIQARQSKKAVIDLISLFQDVILYIGVWLNYVYMPEVMPNEDLVLLTLARLKDWWGELTKLLLKSVEHAELQKSAPLQPRNPPFIRDLYGIKILLSNINDDNTILKIATTIINIITDRQSEEHLSFWNWVENSKNVYGTSCIPKKRLQEFLRYSFIWGDVKDYISQPKQSGYKSLQGTLTVVPPSPQCGGIYIEIQIKSFDMECQAEQDVSQQKNSPKQARINYKLPREQLKQKLFSLKDKKGIINYYPDFGIDYDGVEKTRFLSSRESSRNLIEEVSL